MRLPLTGCPTYRVNPTLFCAGLLWGVVCCLAGNAKLDMLGEAGVLPATDTFTTVEAICNPKYLKGLGGFRPPPLPSSSPASGPAELDCEGNWGQPCEGWRLSVRLETNRFSPECPVLVSAILRNVSGSNLCYYAFDRAIHSGFCNFEVMKGTNLYCPPSGRVTLLGPIRVTVPPATQCRVWARADLLADLTEPGHYRIRGIAPMPVFDPTSNRLLYFTNVVSGYAEFEVLPPPNTASSSNDPDPDPGR